jgi:hypothetical protein
MPLLAAQDLTLELGPGLHLLSVSAWWDGVGDVNYGFLLEVE